MLIVLGIEIMIVLEDLKSVLEVSGGTFDGERIWTEEV